MAKVDITSLAQLEAAVETYVGGAGLSFDEWLDSWSAEAFDLITESCMDALLLTADGAVVDQVRGTSYVKVVGSRKFLDAWAYTGEFLACVPEAELDAVADLAKKQARVRWLREKILE